MLVHKVLQGSIILCDRNDQYAPPTSASRNWKHWKAVGDGKMCMLCRGLHGKIWAMGDIPNIEPPLHSNCRCVIEAMHTVGVGSATKDGEQGADWWLKNRNKLPEYYITSQELELLGWKWGESPAKYAPGKMVTAGIYRNENGHLPDVSGRVWYEADINYYSGKRNKHRILWSNDGLMFVTYDHYFTFYEVK